MKRIIKTVVGSFPRVHTDIEKSIKAVVDLQLRYGIDIVSDGEQRTDMISYFSQELPGLKYEKDKSHIIGKISELENLEEFSKIKDLNLVQEYLSTLGMKIESSLKPQLLNSSEEAPPFRGK